MSLSARLVDPTEKSALRALPVITSLVQVVSQLRFVVTASFRVYFCEYVCSNQDHACPAMDYKFPNFLSTFFTAARSKLIKPSRAQINDAVTACVNRVASEFSLTELKVHEAVNGTTLGKSACTQLARFSPT